MKTVEINLFKFDELSKDAQNVAIENFRNNQEIFLDFFQDECIGQIKEAGFSGNIELQYSLNYCQGDGLSFSFDYFDSEKINEFIKKFSGHDSNLFLDTISNAIYEISGKGNNGRYCYASTKDVDIQYNFPQNGKNYFNIEEILCQILEYIQELYINLCKNLEKQGYSEIEYQCSDEYIIEYIQANEYDFTEDGEDF